MPHCGCTSADGDASRRDETSTLSTRSPRTPLRKSVTGLRLSLAFLASAFSSSDTSPRSTFSLAASITSYSLSLTLNLPTPCSAISSIWSSANSTSNPFFLRRSSTGDEDAAALDAPDR